MITPPDINQEDLKKFLNQQYSCEVIGLTFLPKGETSWGYIVETEKGKYFLKLYPKMLPFLQEATQLTYTLYTSRITHIVNAIPTRTHQTVTMFGEYPAALFNFVEGKEILEQRLTDNQVEELGKIIGKIHKATTIIHDYPKKETFESKDKCTFLDVMKKVDENEIYELPFKEELKKLFQSKKERFIHELQRLQTVGNTLKNKNLPFVICHSDPTAGNILVNTAGELFIIDWDAPLLAPKERDLFFFQDRMSAFMEGYASVVGQTTLDTDALEFYRLEWNIQEIADFGERFFLQNNSDEQNQHDVKRFEEFLDYSGIGR